MEKWKEVHKDNFDNIIDATHKMEVEGGYLYRTLFIAHEKAHIAMCFVPVNKCSQCGYPRCYSCANCREGVINNDTTAIP